MAWQCARVVGLPARDGLGLGLSIIWGALSLATLSSITLREMLGIEVMPGRLDSLLRFIDIKLSESLEKPSAL